MGPGSVLPCRIFTYSSGLAAPLYVFGVMTKVVDVPGFEPGSPKATALQAAELAMLFNTSEVVAIVGFEPTISGI